MTKSFDEEMVRIVDALFLDVAKQAAERKGTSTADALEASWVLFESGLIRLVGDDGRIGVEACDGNRAERRAQAKKNKPLVEYKRRMDRARGSA
jgi:hypothetical protein